jgi:hypothetical protein
VKIMKLVQALLLSAAIASPVLSFAQSSPVPSQGGARTRVVQVDVVGTGTAGQDLDDSSAGQASGAGSAELDRDPLATKEEMMRLIQVLIVG